MEIDGNIWNIQEIYGNIWKHMEIYGNIWKIQEIYGKDSKMGKYISDILEIDGKYGTYMGQGLGLMSQLWGNCVSHIFTHHQNKKKSVGDDSYSQLGET